MADILGPKLLILAPKVRFEFVLTFDEFEDGYANELKPSADRGQVHPKNFLWEKGAFKDLSLTVALHAGLGAMDTPQQVVRTVERLMRLALADIKGKGDSFLDPVRLSIGTFYRRRGYIKEMTPKWKGPFEKDGTPHHCDVSFTFTPVFQKTVPSRNSFSFGSGD